MAKIESELTSIVLKEHFGPIVDKVGNFLQESGPSSLRTIIMETAIPPNLAKKALMILLQHDVVTASRVAKAPVMYQFSLKRLRSFLNYPFYMTLANELFEDNGYFIIITFLTEGRLTISQLLRSLEAITQEEDVQVMRQNFKPLFQKLHSEDFICFSVDVSSFTIEEQLADEEDIDEHNTNPLEILNSLIPATSGDGAGPSNSKKRKRDKKEDVGNGDPDGGLYWRLNTERFDQIRRDRLIAACIRTRHEDEKLEAIASLILELASSRTHPNAPVTIPVSEDQILRMVAERNILSETETKSYLELIQNDQSLSQYFSFADRMYSVKTFNFIEDLVKSCLASVIEKRHSYHHSRIFQIILSKKRLHQKLIEDLAMIPPKDCKQIMFTLVKEAYVNTLYYPKTGNDFTPSKTIFFFAVHLEQVVRMTLSRCYRALQNINIRRNHEYQKNKLLLEKKKFINLTTGEEDAANSGLSSQDSQNIQMAETVCNKLELGQVRVDETIFLLNTWLDMK